MIAIVSLCCWLAGWALLWRVPECEEGERPPRAEGGLCIIIPARNEEARLPRLLESISGQPWRPDEVIVVDDESEDRTAEVARAGGARVISPGELPEGWRGKPWACGHGAAATECRHLMFLDADTWFEPGGLGRAVATYQREPGVLSVVPFHRMSTAAERLSAFFNLMMTVGIGAFTAWGREPDGLFGQMMLIDRETYDSIGGHERVRGQVLENLHLAGHLRAAGVRLRCVSGRGSLSFRMYGGGVREMAEGWAKGFASGAGATSGLIMALSVVWLSGAVMSAVAALAGHHPVGWVAYAAYVLQLFFLLRKVGSFGIVAALFYPVPLLFFFVVFGASVVRGGGGVRWKGRVIRAG